MIMFTFITKWISCKPLGNEIVMKHSTHFPCVHSGQVMMDLFVSN